MPAAKQKTLDAIKGTRFVFAPPRIRTRDEGIEFLEGRFSDQLRCLTDLASAGVSLEIIGVCTHDLAQTSEDLAESIRSGHTIEVGLGGTGFVETLGKAIEQLGMMARSSHWHPKGPDGLSFDVQQETIPVLAEAITRAVSEAAEEARKDWKLEQAARVASVAGVFPRGEAA